MSAIIILFIIILLYPLPCLYSCSILLTGREPQRHSLGLAWLVLFAAGCIVNWSFLSDWQLPVLFLAFFLVVLLLYEGSLYRKLLAVLLTAAIICSGEFITQAFFALFRVTEADCSITVSYWLALLYNLFKYGVSGALCYVAARLHRTRASALSLRYWLLFLPYVFFVFCTIVVFDFLIMQYPADLVISFLAPLGVCLFLTIIAFGFILDKVEKTVRREQENQLRLAVYEKQERQLELTEHNRAEIRKLNDEMKERLDIVSCCIREKRLSEAADYLSQFIKVYEDNKPAVDYGSGVVNYIIDFFQQSCTEKHISLTVAIDKITADFPLDDLDTSELLFNLLNNAVEAAAQTADGQVRFSIIHTAGLWKISCENTYNGQLQRAAKGRGFVTTKKDRLQHGWGSLIIDGLAEKYQGSLQYQTTPEIFAVEIVFTQEALVV